MKKGYKHITKKEDINRKYFVVNNLDADEKKNVFFKKLGREFYIFLQKYMGVLGDKLSQEEVKI